MIQSMELLRSVQLSFSDVSKGVRMGTGCEDGRSESVRMRGMSETVSVTDGREVCGPTPI